MATIKGKIKKWFGKGNQPTRSRDLQLAADSANAASRDCKPKSRKSFPEAENSPPRAIVLSDSTQGCSHTEDGCIPPCEHDDENHDTLPPGRKPQENDVVLSSNRPETSSISSSPTGLNRAHSLHARAHINTPVLVETSRNVKHHDQPENPSVRASSRSRPRSYSLDAEKRPRKRDPQPENSLPPRPKARYDVPKLSADVSANSYANNPGQSQEEKARRGPQVVDSVPKLVLASDSSSHGIGNPIPVHLPANESARSFTTTSQQVCVPKSEQNCNPDAINFTSDCIIRNLECSGPEIGRGSYGKVRKGYFRGTECAVKTLHKELWSNPYGRSLREGFLRECQQFSRMRHPQIVQFMGVNFDSDNRPRLVMELMDCSLKQLLDSRHYISPMTRYKIFLDIIQALAYLHSGNPPVVHRDLTSKNILLTPEWRAKISDLGVAKICGSHEQGTRCPGCPLYMPPEALNPNAPCTPKIDVYSFGVVLKEVFSGSFPNPHNRDRDLQLMMAKLKEEGWSIAWYYLALECLTSEPEHRPTAMNILKRLQDRDMSPPECHDSSAAEPGASAIAKGNCAKQRSMKDASCFSPIIVNVVPPPPPYSELDPCRLNPHPLDPSPVGSRIPVDQSRANPVTYPQQTSQMSLSTSPEHLQLANSSPETQQNTPLESSSIPPNPNVFLEPVQHNPTNLVHSSQESDCQPLQEHTPINPGRSYQDMVHGFSPMYMSSVTPTSANGESGAALQQQQVSSADIDGSELVLVSNQGNIHRRPQGMPTTGHRNTEPDEENLSSNALLGRTQTHQAASDSCTQVDQNVNPSSLRIEPEDSAASLSVQMAQDPPNHGHSQDPVNEQSQRLPMVKLVQIASAKVSEQGLPIKNAVDACVQTDTQDNPTTWGSTVETRVQTELCIDSSEGFVATKSTTDSSLQTDEQSECISNGVLESCEGSNRSRFIFTHKSMFPCYCPLENPQTPDEQCSDLHNKSNSDTVTSQDENSKNSDVNGPFGVDFKCRVTDHSLDFQVPQKHDLNSIESANEKSSAIASSEDIPVAITDADSMSTDSTRLPLHIVKKIVDSYDSLEDSSLQKANYPDSRHDLNAISSLEPRRLSSNSAVQCTSTVFSTFPSFQDIQISLKCRLNRSVTVKACMFKFDQRYLVAVGVAAGRACVCWHISVPDCKAALFLILVAFVKVLFQLYFHYHKFLLPLQNQPTYPDMSKVVVPWKRVASPTGADSLPSVSQCKSLLLSEAFQMCFHPDSEDALPLNLPVIPSDENITVRTYHGKPILFPHNCKPKQFLSTPWKFDYQLPTNPSKMQILPVSNSLIPWLYDLKRSREDNSFPSEFLPAKSNIPLNFPSTISSPRPITHLKASMSSLQRAARAHSASIHTQRLKQSIAPMEYHGTLNLQSEKRLVPEHKLYICTISMLPRRLPRQHCKTNLGLVLNLQKKCILPPVSCCTISSSLTVSCLMSFLQLATSSIPHPQYLKLLASMKQKFVKHHCKKVACILSMHESSDELFYMIQTWMRKSVQSALSQVCYVAHYNAFNPPVEALSAAKEVLKVKTAKSPKPTSHNPTLNKPKFCCLVVHVQLVPTCSFLQQIPAFCTHSILYRVLPHFLDNVCCVAKWLLLLIEWFLALLLLLLVLIKTFTSQTTPDTQTHCYCVQQNQRFRTHSSIHGRQCLIVRQAAQSPYSTMPLTQCSQLSSTMRAKTSSPNALAIIKATSTGEDRIPATKTRHKLLAYMCTWSIAMALKELLHTSRYHITEDLIHSTLEAQCALPMSSSNVALYSFIIKEHGCKVYCFLLLYTLEVPSDCHPGSSVPHAIATSNDCRRMLCVMLSHCENQLQEQLSCESTVLLLGQQSDQLFPRIDGSIFHLYLEWQNASTMQRLCYWPTVSDAPKFPLSPLNYLNIGKWLLHQSAIFLEVYRVPSRELFEVSLGLNVSEEFQIPLNHKLDPSLSFSEGTQRSFEPSSLCSHGYCPCQKSQCTSQIALTQTFISANSAYISKSTVNCCNLSYSSPPPASGAPFQAVPLSPHDNTKTLLRNNWVRPAVSNASTHAHGCPGGQTGGTSGTGSQKSSRSGSGQQQSGCSGGRSNRLPSCSNSGSGDHNRGHPIYNNPGKGGGGSSNMTACASPEKETEMQLVLSSLENPSSIPLSISDASTQRGADIEVDHSPEEMPKDFRLPPLLTSPSSDIALKENSSETDLKQNCKTQQKISPTVFSPEPGGDFDPEPEQNPIHPLFNHIGQAHNGVIDHSSAASQSTRPTDPVHTNLEPEVLHQEEPIGKQPPSLPRGNQQSEKVSIGSDSRCSLEISKDSNRTIPTVREPLTENTSPSTSDGASPLHLAVPSSIQSVRAHPDASVESSEWVKDETNETSCRRIKDDSTKPSEKDTSTAEKGPVMMDLRDSVSHGNQNEVECTRKLPRNLQIPLAGIDVHSGETKGNTGQLSTIYPQTKLLPEPGDTQEEPDAQFTDTECKRTFPDADAVKVLFTTNTSGAIKPTKRASDAMTFKEDNDNCVSSTESGGNIHSSQKVQHMRKKQKKFRRKSLLSLKTVRRRMKWKKMKFGSHTLKYYQGASGFFSVILQHKAACKLATKKQPPANESQSSPFSLQAQKTPAKATPVDGGTTSKNKSQSTQSSSSPSPPQTHGHRPSSHKSASAGGKQSTGGCGDGGENPDDNNNGRKKLKSQCEEDGHVPDTENDNSKTGSEEPSDSEDAKSASSECPHEGTPETVKMKLSKPHHSDAEFDKESSKKASDQFVGDVLRSKDAKPSENIVKVMCKGILGFSDKGHFHNVEMVSKCDTESMDLHDLPNSPIHQIGVMQKRIVIPRLLLQQPMCTIHSQIPKPANANRYVNCPSHKVQKQKCKKKKWQQKSCKKSSNNSQTPAIKWGALHTIVPCLKIGRRRVKRQIRPKFRSSLSKCHANRYDNCPSHKVQKQKCKKKKRQQKPRKKSSNNSKCHHMPRGRSQSPVSRPSTSAKAKERQRPGAHGNDGKSPNICHHNDVLSGKDDKWVKSSKTLTALPTGRDPVMTSLSEPAPLENPVMTGLSEPAPLENPVMTGLSEPAPLENPVMTGLRESPLLENPVENPVMTSLSEPTPLESPVMTGLSESPLLENPGLSESPLLENPVMTSLSEPAPLESPVMTDLSESPLLENPNKADDTRTLPESSQIPSANVDHGLKARHHTHLHTPQGQGSSVSENDSEKESEPSSTASEQQRVDSGSRTTIQPEKPISDTYQGDTLHGVNDESQKRNITDMKDSETNKEGDIQEEPDERLKDSDSDGAVKVLSMSGAIKLIECSSDDININLNGAVSPVPSNCSSVYLGLPDAKFPSNSLTKGGSDLTLSHPPVVTCQPVVLPLADYPQSASAYAYLKPTVEPHSVAHDSNLPSVEENAGSSLSASEPHQLPEPHVEPLQPQLFSGTFNNLEESPSLIEASLAEPYVCQSDTFSGNSQQVPGVAVTSNPVQVEQEDIKQDVQPREQLAPVIKDFHSCEHVMNPESCVLDESHYHRNSPETMRHLQLPMFVEIAQMLLRMNPGGISAHAESIALLRYALLRMQLYGSCSHPRCHGSLPPLCTLLQTLRNNNQVHLETAENLCLALSRCSGMPVRVQCLSTLEQAGYCVTVPLTTYLELCAIGSEDLQQWPLLLLTALIHCKVIFSHYAVPFGAVLSCIAVDVERSCLIIDPCCFSFPQTSQDFISTLVSIAKRVVRVYASYHIKEKHSLQQDTPKYTDPVFVMLLKMIIKLMEHFSMNYSLPTILSPRIVPPLCGSDNPCDSGKGYETPST